MLGIFFRHGAERGASGLWLSHSGFDFLDYAVRFPFRHSDLFFTYPTYPWYYPAPTIFIHYPYYLLCELTGDGRQAFELYALTIVVVAGLLAGLLGHQLRRNGLERRNAVLLGAVLFVSWPMYFSAQRGNVEGMLWTFSAAAVWALLARRPILSALLIGVAGSMKIYPLLFAALLLKEKGRVRLFGIVVATFCAMTYLGLRFLDPDVINSLRWVIRGVARWTKDYGELATPTDYDHSLFGLIKAIQYPKNANFHHWLQIYFVGVGLLASFAYLVRVRAMPIPNQVLFLSCAVVTLPPASFDYTLSVLYVPLAMLALGAVQNDVHGLEVRGLGVVMALLRSCSRRTCF